MEISIKNMVCGRCVKAVHKIFSEDLKMEIVSIELGKVVTARELNHNQFEHLKVELEKEGFVLIDNPKLKLVDKIKSAIIELVHYKDISDLNINFSAYLSQQLHKDYHYLSTLFSSIENITIEQFIILQKTEKVKELLVYNELSLSEIAYKSGYSSAAHLSNQFKKITGFTPTLFRKLKTHSRKELDKISLSK